MCDCEYKHEENVPYVTREHLTSSKGMDNGCEKSNTEVIVFLFLFFQAE